VLPVTCEVGLSRSVNAFHIMPGLPGPEGQLHDHDYRIEIVVDREQLDDRGMVCDLDVLEAALAELTSRVEGRNLEEIRPPGAEAVAGVGDSRRVWRIPRTMLTRCPIIRAA
jgi:6-pyruvoyltetrahydropterin/6-carboxytetrahydropterin synthase